MKTITLKEDIPQNTGNDQAQKSIFISARRAYIHTFECSLPANPRSKLRISDVKNLDVAGRKDSSEATALALKPIPIDLSQKKNCVSSVEGQLPKINKRTCGLQLHAEHTKFIIYLSIQITY